ncbi:PREDICTED: uncharacterized protein LOC108752867 [Trachymyrmex septentrionalis]|uniref:uncharacterized protein LOC108752867 n=1 Tax=Trachymyrmex septentrionalis TaxID=34720 RepID=UPI00084EE537|nr:PREDICTED: uncharacterized protein LOC108752867 [Trachymyrmex septentrionalis]
MHVEFSSYTAAFADREITGNSEITTREHGVYPQTARMFPGRNDLMAKFLNPTREESTIRSIEVLLCPFLRNICSPLRNKYCEIFLRLKRTPGIFSTAKCKIDETFHVFATADCRRTFNLLTAYHTYARTHFLGWNFIEQFLYSYSGNNA